MRKLTVKEQKVCNAVVKKIIRRYRHNIIAAVATVCFVIALSAVLLYCVRDMGALMFTAIVVLTLVVLPRSRTSLLQ